MSKDSNQSILLNILKNNFLTTAEQEDGVDLANAGEVGFAINLFSDIQDSNDFDLKEKFAQVFPESAYIPKFVYKHVTRHGVTDYFAKPAITTIYLTFSVSAFKKRAILNNGVYQLIFPTALKVNVDKYDFTLFHPLVISVYERERGDVVTAKYDITTKNSISKITTEPLSIYRVNDDKMMIALEVGQYTIDTNKELIRVVDLGSQTEYVYPADGDIAGFDVRVLKSNGSMMTLVAHNAQSSVSATDASPFVYWDYDGSSLTFMFSTEYYHYRPDVGDTLVADIYHTDGVRGNFKYYGDEFGLTYPTSEQDVYSQRLQQVKFEVTMETNVSSGGENEKTIAELQPQAVTINTNKGSINSDSELEAYFSNKGIKIQEIRGDIAVLLYRGDMVVGQSSNNIIPTRNINILFDPKTTQPFSTKTIRQGSCVVPITTDPYGENNTYEVDDSITAKLLDWRNNLSDIYDLDSNGQLMSMPFTTTIYGNGPGVAFTSFYKNENIRLSADQISQTSIQQTPMSFFTISRDPLRDECWTIDIPVIMDTITLETFMNDTSSIKMIFIIKDNEGSDVYAFESSDTHVDSEFPEVIHFSKKLYNDENIDISGNLKVIMNNEPVIQIATGNKIGDSVIYIPNELSIDVMGFVKDGSVPDSDNTNPLVKSNVLSLLTDGYEQVCTYKSDVFALTKDFTNMMRPYIEPIIPPNDFYTYEEDVPKRYSTDVFENGVDEDGKITSTILFRAGGLVKDNNGDQIYLFRAGDYDFNRPKPKSITYKISDIPVVRSTFLLDRSRANTFYTDVAETKEAMESDDFIRTSNMTIMMRCMNCFGSSSEYYAKTSTQTKLLDRTDIKIAFAAKFKSNITTSQISNTLKLMKDDISTSIAETNIAGSMKINELITRVTKNYENELDSLYFIGINNMDSDFQAIERTVSDSSNGSGDFIKVREELNRAKFMNGIVDFSDDIDIVVMNTESTVV